MRVFDPRDGQWKESDNPVLMVAQFARDAGGDMNDAAVTAEANYADALMVTCVRCGVSLAETVDDAWESDDAFVVHGSDGTVFHCEPCWKIDGCHC